jgi:hypothetical protein
MPVLSALVPGFRELRTPLAVGAAWGVVLLLILRDNPPHFVERTLEALSLLPDALALPLILGGVYLVGVLAVGIQDILVEALRGLELRIRRRVTPESRAGRISPGFSIKAIESVNTGLRERLRPTSELVAQVAPFELVLDEFDIAAIGLNKEAPEQYQQYDRLRSEGEFRKSIIAPIVALAAIWALGDTNILFSIIVLLFAIGIGWLLGYQAKLQEHRAQELLASAFYFRLTSTPLVESLVQHLERTCFDAEGHHVSEAGQLASFTRFLYARHLLDRHGPVIGLLVRGSTAYGLSGMDPEMLDKFYFFLSPEAGVAFASTTGLPHPWDADPQDQT